MNPSLPRLASGFSKLTLRDGQKVDCQSVGGSAVPSCHSVQCPRLDPESQRRAPFFGTQPPGFEDELEILNRGIGGVQEALSSLFPCHKMRLTLGVLSRGCLALSEFRYIISY